jgi:hypothetical protein
LFLQVNEEQQQVINKIAASVAPLLGSRDCVLLTLIVRKDGAESAEDQTTKRQPTAPETQTKKALQPRLSKSRLIQSNLRR